MIRILMDTSAFAFYLRNHPQIAGVIREAEEICISPVMLGEVYAGLHEAKYRKENEETLHKFLAGPRVTVLSVGNQTALYYGEILHYLRSQGTPIPSNDVWIAASAMEHGLRLVTTDTHFHRIPHILRQVYNTAW